MILAPVTPRGGVNFQAPPGRIAPVFGNSPGDILEEAD